MLAISSNKWFRAAYGAKLRAHVAETVAVQSITDVGELPVFEAAATFPMIIVAQNRGDSCPVRFTQVKSLDEPYPDVVALASRQGQDLPPGAVADLVLRCFGAKGQATEVAAWEAEINARVARLHGLQAPAERARSPAGFRLVLPRSDLPTIQCSRAQVERLSNLNLSSGLNALLPRTSGRLELGASMVF